MEQMDYLVIGTGPSGVSATAALLARGASVRVVDPGVRLEPEKTELTERLRSKAPEQWTPNDLQFLKEGLKASPSGFETKLCYGSDFPYRWEDPLVRYESLQTPQVKASFAPGGLSNVWGAGILPFMDAELASWPIAKRELDPHFRAALKLMNYSATHDELEEHHPLHGEPQPALRLSAAAARFLADTRRHSDRLKSSGVRVAPARLAVKAVECRYCGLCLYGCPWGLIWNSVHGLRELERQYGSKLDYRAGWTADTIAEKDGWVEVSGSTRGTVETLSAGRVFLGAGCIPSTRILLKSGGHYDLPAPMIDSQYFMFPFLRWRSAGDVFGERMTTLAQLFVSLMAPRISRWSIHLSVYSFNDQIGGLLRNKLAIFGPLATPLTRFLAHRMLVFGGYLHSDESSRLKLTLRQPDGDGISRLILSHQDNPRTHVAARGAARTLLRLWHSLGGVPLVPMLQVKDPGTSYHFGGSFPMTEKPTEIFQSDKLGRPTGYRRVHLIDSSCLPSIPASTITLSVMANAHRIATAAPKS